MSEMFVANGTRQVISFQYRLPEGRQPISMTIPPATQIKLQGRPGGLTTTDVDAIIDQWTHYGMQRTDLVPSVKGVVPVAYQLDKPITAKQIEALFFHNDNALDAEGRQLRKLAAVAVTANIQERLAGTPAGVRAMDISIVEEEPRKGYDPDRNPLGEGFKFTRGQEPAEEPRGRRRRSARA